MEKYDILSTAIGVIIGILIVKTVKYFFRKDKNQYVKISGSCFPGYNGTYILCTKKECAYASRKDDTLLEGYQPIDNDSAEATPPQEE